MSPMNEISDMRIRTAERRDRDFILSLVPRLMEFGPPPWRDAGQMTATDKEVIEQVLLTNPPGTIILLAEDRSGAPLGFIHLNTTRDYFTRERHGHISDIVVAPAGEGRGVGRVLMEAGEEWARSQGFRLLTLNVFANNRRALNLYERLGYGQDTIKYVKELG
jgi:ribosomal protein S18 acetylase RimI-like enzyme